MVRDPARFHQLNVAADAQSDDARNIKDVWADSTRQRNKFGKFLHWLSITKGLSGRPI